MKISKFEDALKMMEWRKAHWHKDSAVAEKIHENKIKEREDKLKIFPYSVIDDPILIILDLSYSSF